MFSFPKQERLCSKYRIDSLFSHGKAFISYPFSVRFLAEKGEGRLRVLIVCSKRYHKKAVNRNYIKRRIREAWRLNNHSLKSTLKENRSNMDISLSFVSKEKYNYHEIEKQIKKILLSLQHSFVQK